MHVLVHNLKFNMQFCNQAFNHEHPITTGIDFYRYEIKKMFGRKFFLNYRLFVFLVVALHRAY